MKKILLAMITIIILLGCAFCCRKTGGFVQINRAGEANLRTDEKVYLKEKRALYGDFGA